ncbi:TPA: hypothetical protein IV340_002753 [Enterococcus faecium]|nr:hypothetical protein [Enterococcus faecium]
MVTLFYRRDFLFSIYTKYFTLSAKLTKPIELTKYHMYVNFSKIGLYNQIKKLAELTGKKVIFERW